MKLLRSDVMLLGFPCPVIVRNHVPFCGSSRHAISGSVAAGRSDCGSDTVLRCNRTRRYSFPTRPDYLCRFCGCYDPPPPPGAITDSNYGFRPCNYVDPTGCRTHGLEINAVVERFTGNWMKHQIPMAEPPYARGPKWLAVPASRPRVWIFCSRNFISLLPWLIRFSMCNPHGTFIERCGDPLLAGCAERTDSPSDDVAEYLENDRKERGLHFEKWIECETPIQASETRFALERNRGWLPGYVPGSYQFRRTVVLIS